MNGEGGIGEYEENIAYRRGDFVTGVDFGDSFPGGFYPDISVGFSPFNVAPPPIFPTVVVLPGSTQVSNGDSTAPGDSALPESVIDPELDTQTTVFESVPGGIYETSRAPTDWDRVYDEYVILNPQVPTEVDVPFHEDIFAGVIDWGATILGGVLDPVGIGEAIRQSYAPGLGTTVTGIPSLGQQTSLSAPISAIPGGTVEHGCPPYGPKYAKICLATNVITPLRRRRRRRLLTSSDIKDLSALKSIVGGAALQAAVTQAVRR